MKRFIENQRIKRQDRKAERAARTPLQKQLHFAAVLLLCATLLASVTTSTAITTGAISIIVYMIAVAKIKKKKLSPSAYGFTFLILIAPFPALSIMSNLMEIPALKNEIIEARSYADTHPGEISMAAKDFAKQLESGNISAIIDDTPGRLAGTSRDALAYWLQEQAVKIGLPKDIRPEDARAVVPINQLLFGDRTVTLYNANGMQSVVDARSKQTDQLYTSIIFVTCVLDRNGEVMSLTALPKPGYAELRHHEEAAPLLESCEAFARGKTPPETRPFGEDFF
jgi:hypothetical protein